MKQETISLLVKYEETFDINILRKILLEYSKEGLSINTIFGGFGLLHLKQPYENVKLLLDRGADPNTYLVQAILNLFIYIMIVIVLNY